MVQMFEKDKRLNNEKKTLTAMFKIYCNKNHSTKKELCTECKQLLDYALIRVEKCKLGSNKPNCAKCKIHCYKKDMRENVIKVMRYSGPRMLLYHPVLVLKHLANGFRFK